MSWTALLAVAASVAVHLFTLGLAVVATLGVAGRLGHRLRPRRRYAVALAGFWLAVSIPVLAAQPWAVWASPGGALGNGGAEVREAPPWSQRSALPAGSGGAGGSRAGASLPAAAARGTGRVGEAVPPAPAGPAGMGRLATSLALAPLWVLVAGLGVWAAGAAICLARELRGIAALRRSRRAWRPVPPPVARARRLPTQLPLATGRDGGPMAVGWIHPAIYLPAWAWRLPDRELRALVAHEAEHLRWRDPLLHLLARLALAALWPALHLRLAYRWVCLEREAAADAAAVEALGVRGDAPLAWAELLVAAARPGTAGTVGAASELQHRLRRLLGQEPALSRWRVASRWVLTVALWTAVAGGGVMSPGAWAAPRAVDAAERAGWTVIDHLRGENATIRVVDRRQVNRNRQVIRRN